LVKDGYTTQWKMEFSNQERFNQVPGKAFTDSPALVMTDLAFRVAHIIQIMMKLRTVQFNIETAFLYSDLDEVKYMQIQEGYV
jgi:hypothetical protein